MDQSSSIKSSFQLIDYKIDQINFSLTPETQFLAEDHGNKLFDIEFMFRDPQKFIDNEETYYVNGIQMLLKVLVNEEVMANGTFSISGLFKTTGEFSQDIEQRLVKEQIPAILFPYLRAAVTNILASAGFGSAILPLVNIQKMAGSLNLEIIEKKHDNK
ncbi:protein-export chaperone SecB [Treponema phagedenis]|uniref:Uncharacterized protein n=1 Tax=Treponema phagedenis TaxID=162 RepID=A0A0B7GT66_TREPH|nr:protein-export chaperone SecB [Treponema phagedenis]NVP22659.1 protein-export chaperone SecB [Treponema phagedenis]QEJ94683.1 hypothetical protein FUT79_05330 [Treponema phagedenis]QEJ95218.1 hypothetical protein FUT79_08405 [Treponema phagedenis]QEJ97363.1 hypothetical protein FUT82_04710 [Treponema phagedenis]QEJ98630.1 hypothetical protein FUT82_11885 [Treponema phagedenis]